MAWTHYFDEDMARELGINAAVMLSEVRQWIRKNKIEKRNEIDGKTWTFNSVEKWKILLPFFSSQQIRDALSKLREAGILVVSNHNEKAYDRTLWYAFADENKWIGSTEQMDSVHGTDQLGLQTEPIPSSLPSSLPSVGSPKGEPKIDTEKGKRVRAISDRFYILYGERRNGAKPTWGVKEVKLVWSDILRVGDERLLKLLSAWFQQDLPGPLQEWQKKAGMEYASFHSQIDKLFDCVKDADEPTRKVKCQSCGEMVIPAGSLCTVCRDPIDGGLKRERERRRQAQ
jgi:hypothetical protein